MENHKYKIMVSSAVYGFESELNQICAVLDNLNYDVLCSHIGTIKVDPRLSNMDNCLNAVRECDLFFGIIRPYCGTGNIGDVPDPERSECGSGPDAFLQAVLRSEDADEQTGGYAKAGWERSG